MPLPLLLIPIITTGARYLLGTVAGGIALEYLKRKASAYFDDYTEHFLATAAADMGLDLSDGGHITDDSLTAMVNAKLLAGTGVQVDSVLDRDKLRAGLEKLAIQRLAVQVGVAVGDAQTLGGIKAAFQSWAGEQVKAQLQSESGQLLDAAKPSAFVQRVIDQSPEPKAGWNDPQDMSKKGVSNRARQAKYRHAHKRTWVPKNENSH